MQAAQAPATVLSLVRRLLTSCLALLVLLFASAPLGAQATQKVLYAFTGGSDGSQPYSGVVLDKAGNLYGTAQFGGAFGQGTVFELIPSQNGWTFNLLYTFTGGTDGAVPIGGIIVDDAGSLYGAASAGGDPTCRCGNVFQLTPSQAGWTFKVLYTFIGGKDGAYPGASLSFDNHGGSLYGTTVSGGGAGNFGTAFNVPLSGGRDFVFPLNGANGNQPFGSITGGLATSYFGGKFGKGNIFELSWGHHVKAFHVFNPTGKLGFHPLGNLIEDAQFNEYGTTYSGGVGHNGTVYKMTYNHITGGGAWAAIHSFSGNDGTGAGAGLVFDAAGNLYGTTMFGGAAPGYAGTVFKLTPAAKNQWTHTLLYSFNSGNDGGTVTSGVVLDNAGNLYGTTLYGGPSDNGVVFEVTP
jgi:uncharacterized repeat protein (TIGR03803 family)